MITVGLACTLVYAVLFATLFLVAVMIIPVDYLGGELERASDLSDYANLVWLAASMGTMAGAVGSSLDDSERIRNATYSLREWHRRRGWDEAREAADEPAAASRE